MNEPAWAYRTPAFYKTVVDGSVTWEARPYYNFLTVTPNRIDWTDMVAGPGGYDSPDNTIGPDTLTEVGRSFPPDYQHGDFTHEFEFGFTRYDETQGQWGYNLDVIVWGICHARWIDENYPNILQNNCDGIPQWMAATLFRAYATYDYAASQRKIILELTDWNYGIDEDYFGNTNQWLWPAPEKQTVIVNTTFNLNTTYYARIQRGLGGTHGRITLSLFSSSARTPETLIASFYIDLLYQATFSPGAGVGALENGCKKHMGATSGWIANSDYGVVAQAIQPTGVESASSVGEPAVGVGPVSVAPTATESASSMGEPSVVPGAVTIAPAEVVSAPEVGSPAVAQPGSGSCLFDISGIEATLAEIQVSLALIKAKTDNLPADPASQTKLDFVEKWILNRLVESPDGTTFTLYDDDNSTPLKVWAYSSGTKTRSKAT